MNEDLLKSIENTAQKKDSAAQQVAAEEVKITWLIFLINGVKYALPSFNVKEIIHDMNVYQIPFVPNYIEGLINVRGEPYTVIEPCVLLEVEKKDTKQGHSLFIILNILGDRICLRIEDVLNFYELPESGLRILKHSDNESFIFKGTINFNGEEIPVIEINAFEMILKKDLCDD